MHLSEHNLKFLCRSWKGAGIGCCDPVRVAMSFTTDKHRLTEILVVIVTEGGEFHRAVPSRYCTINRGQTERFLNDWSGREDSRRAGFRSVYRNPPIILCPGVFAGQDAKLEAEPAFATGPAATNCRRGRDSS